MEENFLSPELLKELSGCGSEDVLCTSSKRKRSKTVEQDVGSPEQQPLSKSARKKQEQLQMKKDRESKRSEYFKQISDNSISEDKRKLLICTKDMGQANSNRRKLKRSLSKHRAGIPLNSNEMDLLFTEKNRNDVMRTSSREEPAELSPSLNSCVGMKPLLAEGYQSTISSSTPATGQFPNLLQQFENIKAREGSKSENISLSKRESGCNSDSSRPCDASATRKPYLPVNTVIPISERGRVTSSLQQHQKDDSGPIKPSGLYFLNRDPLIQESRLKLPICGMEQEIVEAISANDVVILCGETGSGKSTQVPQFLYENGFSSSGLIGITQPRRVAVTSTASRVAVEMGCPFDDSAGGALNQHTSNLVGFQIRHDSSTLNTNMHIKFMTDGILLKEISSDILLKRYNVVILDEAHERNVNTDVLLGMLSRAIPLRKRQHEAEVAEWLKIPVGERDAYDEPIKPLRLVIMSATLRVDDFLTKRLFAVMPPVIKVESRQYSVKTHFSKRTETSNYLEEAFQKVCQIHKKLPAGSILLFLTGKREISYMCRRLSKELNNEHSVSSHWDDEDDVEDGCDGLLGSDEKEAIADKLFQDTDNTAFEKAVEHESLITVKEQQGQSPPSRKALESVESSTLLQNQGSEANIVRNNLLKEALRDKRHIEEVVADSTERNISNNIVSTNNVDISNTPKDAPPKLDAAMVLPLYAMLASDRQKLVFQEPPEGHRLIVIATNVAETSITIPGVRYVVDCGRQKERIIDVQSGISKYKVTWISQASANQRMGRAGRTGPGHCYRLYSSSFFNHHMIDFQKPEICTFPLEDLVLQLRAIGIHNVDTFPFPTPPPLLSLVRAETLLTNLGAIQVKRPASDGKGLSALESINSIMETEKNVKLARGGITSLGKNMAKFPINARLAKMLIVGHKAGSIPMGLCISVVVSLTERTIFCTPNTSKKKSHCYESDIDDDDKIPSREDDIDYYNDDDNTDATACNLWMHSTSDVLARVRALGAFSFFMRTYQSSMKGNEVSIEKAALSFCESRGLHHSTLCRCLQLFKQLCYICQAYLSRTTDETRADFETLPPPNETQETALRQIMLTGFGDSIARRVPAGSSIFPAEFSKRKKLTAYLSCDPTITTPLFIHPHSALFQKDPLAPLPEYVIYTELLMSEDGETTYMSGVTQISPSWISELTKDCPLLQWSPPMKFPVPYYDKKNDRVMCFASSTYGIHKWELPVREYDMVTICRLSTMSSHSNDKQTKEEVYRWFGRFLLEGKVVSHIAELRKIFSKSNMLEPPSVLTDVKSNRKAEILIKFLAKHNICSLCALRAQVKKNKNCLVNELQFFFKEKLRNKFVVTWDKNLPLF